MIILFQQFFEDVGNFYCVVGGFDMSYDALEVFIRAVWEKKNLNYLYIDRSKQQKKANFI